MPELTGYNKLPARATLYPFQYRDSVKRCREDSKWFSSLNGEGTFLYFKVPVAIDSLENNGDIMARDSGSVKLTLEKYRR